NSHGNSCFWSLSAQYSSSKSFSSASSASRICVRSADTEKSMVEPVFVMGRCGRPRSGDRVRLLDLQADLLGAADDFVALVVADMLEQHDAGVRVLGALALGQNVRLRAQRVADLHRVGEAD